MMLASGSRSRQHERTRTQMKMIKNITIITNTFSNKCNLNSTSYINGSEAYMIYLQLNMRADQMYLNIGALIEPLNINGLQKLPNVKSMFELSHC